MPLQPPDGVTPSKRSLPASCDVAIVGAGPAGVAAATLAAELGLDTVLLDERNEPGGQIFNDLSAASPQRREALGPEYEHGMALLAALGRSRAQFVAGASVAGAQGGADGYELCIARDREASILHARCLILAPGAVERPLRIEGSTLPGVTSAGEALGQLQTSALVPEGRVALAGCGPLLYLAAQQLRRAGANVVALLDTLSARRFVRALPGAVEFMRSPYYARGAKLLREINDTVPIYHDVIELAALGNDKLTSVRFTANKRTHTLIADRLVLHQGIVPEIQLADLLGCDDSLGRRCGMLETRGRCLGCEQHRRCQYRGRRCESHGGGRRCPTWRAFRAWYRHGPWQDRRREARCAGRSTSPGARTGAARSSLSGHGLSTAGSLSRAVWSRHCLSLRRH